MCLLRRVAEGSEQVLTSLVYVRARGSKRFQEGEDLLAIFHALLGVDFCDVPSVGVICIKQGILGPTMMNGRDLVCQIMDICQTRVQSQTAGRRK